MTLVEASKMGSDRKQLIGAIISTRRKQVDRSAATRNRVIAATVRLLHRHGYTGATTLSIAQEAGVSLGALQHQFPTKASLMAAVVRRFAANWFVKYRAALQDLPRGVQQFEKLTEMSWQLIGTPELAANMEIHLAMRNDIALMAEVAPIFDRHGAFIRSRMSRMLADEPGFDQSRLDILRLLSSAIMAGMSMQRHTPNDPEMEKRALETWHHILMSQLLPNSSSKGCHLWSAQGG
jgi:AcrR family transcriptional regulator